jgi:Mlc titration factor MtfA (ptsG expression regulator)
MLWRLKSIFSRTKTQPGSKRRPFDPSWEPALAEHLAVWESLQEQEKEKLRERIAEFLATKRFEGCGGLAVTSEMKLVIAAMACMLVVHSSAEAFPLCESILVYPEKYVKTIKVPGPGGMIQEREITASGESWTGLYGSASGGPVILSWRDVAAAAAGLSGGRNVVHHEFAHQLDALDGSMDGAPRLANKQAASQWQQVFSREYSQMHRDLAQHVPTFLNPYGATSPAEFFAVATEHYFADPATMQARHPDLYAQLHAFYASPDPA